MAGTRIVATPAGCSMSFPVGSDVRVGLNNAWGVRVGLPDQPSPMV